MSNKNRKEICGVDPNTWGDFDQALDGARKVAKYILPVLGTSLMAGCSAEMLGATVRTEQAPEVSPLPADFTATPTEVMVEMPTLTPEPTATATETPEPTATEVVVSKEVAKLNQRIQDFLNSEGKYTEESLAKMAHLGFDYYETLKGNYLGLMKVMALIDGQQSMIRDTMDWNNSIYTLADFQAIYLGGQLKDDYVVFYMGMKDKSGNRFVVPIGKPMYPEDGDVMYNGFSGSNTNGAAKNVGNHGANPIPSKLTDFPRWEKAYDQVALFACYLTPISGFMRDIFINNIYENRSDEALIVLDDSVPLCRGLFNETIDVRGNGGAIIDGADNNFLRFDSTNFNSVEEDLNIFPYVAYDVITFVRP